MPTIAGSVLVHDTNAGAAGLQVAVTEHGVSDGVWVAPKLGAAMTDTDGNFTITVDPAKDLGALVLQVFQATVGMEDSKPPIAQEMIGTVAPDATIDVSLRVPAAALADSAPPNLARTIKIAADRSRILQAADFPGTQQWFDQIDLLRGQGRTLVGRLALKEASVRTRSFVADEEESGSKIDEVVRAGLEQIGTAKGKLKGVQLTVDRDRLAGLGFEIADTGALISAPATIDHERLKDLMKGGVGLAPGLRRKKDDCESGGESIGLLARLMGAGSRRSPSGGIPADTGDAGSDPAAPGDGTGDSGAAAPGAPAPASPTGGTDETVADLTTRILAALDRPQPEIGFRPDEVTLKEDLNTEIVGGPSDATAYHDFHSLQIAFDNVWTAMVDEDMADEIADLYGRAVQISREHGSSFEPTDDEFNGIRSLLRAMRRQTGKLKLGIPDQLDLDLDRLQRTLEGVEKRLGEGFAFDVFARDSYNFGILTTYRQRWQPLSYQTGDLVASIPLAPGEKRTFIKRQVVKEKRAEREVKKSIFSRAVEDQRTGRADTEIVRNATSSTNFDMSSEGSISIGIEGVGEGGLTRTTRFQANQAQESAETRRSFRESVRKAATEYRNERTLEVSTETGIERSLEEKGEISNPNTELTVTYLFYELQRRYHVNEKLHAVTPVILVALPVPKPSEIDESWLLAHEWILRRVLLDDSMHEAFDGLVDGFVGEEMSVQTLRTQWEAQLEVVKDLKENAGLRKSDLHNARARVDKQSKKKVRKEGLIEKTFESLFGGADNKATAASRAEAAARVLEFAEEDLAHTEDTLSVSLTALKEATDAFLEAVKSRQQRRLSIDRLRMHVKQNILHYMQAVWSSTPPDQRYFDLYDIQVLNPVPDGECLVKEETVDVLEDIMGGFLSSVVGPVERTVVRVECPPPKPGSMRPLHEVADLDRLLGFKGNYGIFPLRESNALTDFMMQDYADDKEGIVDPADIIRSIDPFDLISRYKCGQQKATLTGRIPDPAGVMDRFRDALESRELEGEIVIVPTAQLFIEALPGKRPLLEDFKLRHRAVDVAKAHEELRQAELETLRLAARLVAGERQDPDTERTVIVRGDGADGVHVDVDPA